MSVESVSIPVEYIITTTSDWTKFHIVEGGFWSDVKIECLKGCDKIRLQQVIDNTIIAIDKRQGDTDLVEVKARCTLNIDEKYVNSQISHVITKGDLGSTKVGIIVQGKEIVRKTNRFNIPDDRHNPHDFMVSATLFTSAFPKQWTKADLEVEYFRLVENEVIYQDELSSCNRLKIIVYCLLLISLPMMVIPTLWVPQYTPFLEIITTYPLQFYLFLIGVILFIFLVPCGYLIDRKASRIKDRLGLSRTENSYLGAYDTYNNIISHLNEPNSRRKPYFRKSALESAEEMVAIVEGWNYGNIPLIREFIGKQIDVLKNNMRRLILPNVAEGDEKALRKISEILLEFCKHIKSPSIEGVDKLNNMIEKLPFKEYKAVTKKEKIGEYLYSRPRASRILFASITAIIVAVVLYFLGQNIGVIFAVSAPFFWGALAGFDKLFRIKEKEEVKRVTGRLRAYMSSPKIPKEEDEE